MMSTLLTVDAMHFAASDRTYLARDATPAEKLAWPRPHDHLHPYLRTIVRRADGARMIATILAEFPEATEAEARRAYAIAEERRMGLETASTLDRVTDVANLIVALMTSFDRDLAQVCANLRADPMRLRRITVTLREHCPGLTEEPPREVTSHLCERIGTAGQATAAARLVPMEPGT